MNFYDRKQPANELPGVPPLTGSPIMAQPDQLNANLPSNKSPFPTGESVSLDSPEIEEASIPLGRNADVEEFKSVIAQLDAQRYMKNIAGRIDRDELDKIASRVVNNYELDLESCKDWQDRSKVLFELAKLITEPKTIGGEPAANVKYPLITNAAIQFNSRAYPQIVKGKDIVKAVVVGKDVSGDKAARGKRIADHMSYQLLYGMQGWEEDVDQLLITMPILGCAFKKTYYSEGLQQNVSELVFPKDLVVDYYAKSLESARRVTHVINLTRNEIVERIRSELFLNVDVDELVNSSNTEEHEREGSIGEKDEKSFPEYGVDSEDDYVQILEQHCWLDLDKDGYQEPYVVFVHAESQKVLRISARYDFEGIMVNDKEEIVHIEAVNYFTRFLFMPGFDGGFYGQGFGALLQPHSETINSLLNQLLDAGKLANKQVGFISSRARIAKNLGKNNELKFLGGELKSVDASGGDLKNSIYFMPIKEPSSTLFSLLGLMVDSGKEISSVSEVLSGESPGPNVPATTTLALIEQGMKVFSGIYKRIHRGLKSEFNKLRRLNKLYLDDQRYNSIIDDAMMHISRDDYASDDCDIFPVSDPTNANDTTRYLKAQALLQLVGQGFNDEAIKRRYLESLQIENVEDLLPSEEEMARPDPLKEMQMQKMQLEIQREQAELRKVLAETELIMQKVRSEQVIHGVKAAGVSLDEEKLAIERAQVLSGIQAQRTAEQRERERSIRDANASRENISLEKTKQVVDFTKSQEKKMQGPYNERGLASNNI